MITGGRHNSALRGFGLSLGPSLVLFILFVIAQLLLAHVAFAADSQPGTNYNTLNEAFQNASGRWIAPLQTIAKSVFWSLALIELILVTVPLALKGADLGEISFALVKLILFLGFFYALVLDGSRWMNDVIQSFMQAGSQAGGVTYAGVGGILDLGVQTAMMIMGQFSLWHGDGLGTAMTLFVGALVILVCFAVIAILMAMALFESYFVIGAASLFFALGGSQFTASYARTTFMSALSIGAKLMMLELISGAGYDVVKQWVAQYQQNDASLFGLIALCLMFALTCAFIPSVVSRLMGGQGGGNPLSTVLAGVGAAMGAGLAAKAAMSLAGAQLGGGGTGSTAAASLAGAGGADDGSSAGGGNGSGGGVGDGGGSGGMSASSGSGDAGATATNLGGPMSGRSANASGSSGSSGASGGSAKRAATVGAQVALATLNVAGHALKHMHRGSNMGHAMASDMNNRASLLQKPSAPTGAPPDDVMQDGGSISGSNDFSSPLDTKAGENNPPPNT